MKKVQEKRCADKQWWWWVVGEVRGGGDRLKGAGKTGCTAKVRWWVRVRVRGEGEGEAEGEGGGSDSASEAW